MASLAPLLPFANRYLPDASVDLFIGLNLVSVDGTSLGSIPVQGVNGEAEFVDWSLDLLIGGAATVRS